MRSDHRTLLPNPHLTQRKAELQHEIFVLRQSLRSDSSDPNTWVQLGDRLSEFCTYRPSNARFQRAREAYERAMLAAPDDPVPFNNLGVLWCDHGEYTRALELLERARELDDQDATIHENLATAKRYLGQRIQLDFPTGLHRKPRTQSALFDPLDT